VTIILIARYDTKESSALEKSEHGYVILDFRNGGTLAALDRMEMAFAYFAVESPNTTVPSGDSMLLSSPGHARLVDTETVDWDRIRDWISTCSTDPQHFDCQPMNLALDDFRVIDCLSRAVVPLPPKAKYAALSYVWGPSSSSEPLLDGNRLPATTPMAIEDAMQCTTQLGFRYLWVDRYCIDQASPSKHLQIHNMDLIYGCASVTIVNAAGNDSECGLPGVTKQTRISQESFFIGGKRFLQIPPAGAIIRNSKWASRGWTLQEGHLSKVRLVFTPSQVFFQCRTRHSCESMAGVFKLSERTNTSYHPRSTQAFTHYDRHSNLDWWSVFQDLLAQYLLKSLKYDSDILVAFQAILKSLEVNHFWGIPFRLEDQPSPEAALLFRLTWFPAHGQDSPLVLRRGFPTWSWAAWKGKWLWNYEGNNERNPNVEETSLTIEMTTGQRCSLVEYCSIIEHTGDPNLFLPFLDVQGWTTLVQFRQDHTKRAFWSTLVLDIEGRYIPTTRAQIMEVILPEEPEWDWSQVLTGTWPVLVMIEKEGDGDDADFMVGGIVLKSCQNGSHQRIGILQRTVMNLERNSEGRLQLWHKYGGGILECERRSIRLA
jgi:hypothetical protein